MAEPGSGKTDGREELPIPPALDRGAPVPTLRRRRTRSTTRNSPVRAPLSFPSLLPLRVFLYPNAKPPLLIYGIVHGAVPPPSALLPRAECAHTQHLPSVGLGNAWHLAPTSQRALRSLTLLSRSLTPTKAAYTNAVSPRTRNT